MIDDDLRICRSRGPGPSVHASVGFNPIPIGDVESCLRECSDAFGQLAALLSVIKEKAGEHSELGKLAELGRTVADDLENYADATREQLKEGGTSK